MCVRTDTTKYDERDVKCSIVVRQIRASTREKRHQLGATSRSHSTSRATDNTNRDDLEGLRKVYTVSESGGAFGGPVRLRTIVLSTRHISWSRPKKVCGVPVRLASDQLFDYKRRRFGSVFPTDVCSDARTLCYNDFIERQRLTV